jgi:hypothetical protein
MSRHNPDSLVEANESFNEFFSEVVGEPPSSTTKFFTFDATTTQPTKPDTRGRSGGPKLINMKRRGSHQQTEGTSDIRNKSVDAMQKLAKRRNKPPKSGFDSVTDALEIARINSDVQTAEGILKLAESVHEVMA